MNTIGKRISEYRKKKNLKQDELAEMLGVSPQAVSKWENDLSCPDISLLPELSKILGISIDELVQGKKEEPTVEVIPEDKHKEIDHMIMSIEYCSYKGDTTNINLPISYVRKCIETRKEIPQICNIGMFKKVDLDELFALIISGATGELVEIESYMGDSLCIYVE
jgi:transcriptional regulator with XRE-family HTH domain